MRQLPTGYSGAGPPMQVQCPRKVPAVPEPVTTNPPYGHVREKNLHAAAGIPWDAGINLHRYMTQQRRCQKHLIQCGTAEAKNDDLLEVPARVAALVRPESLSKPATETLRRSGVEIRVGDINDSVEKLTETLTGVDVFISTVTGWLVEEQKGIIRAAKAAGVKRVIPCDFATPGDKGVQGLLDQKLAIREFIQELGVPYTFIDVGWWMQLSLPHPDRSSSPLKNILNTVYGDGDDRMLVTDLNHIGTYVARIIADPRTLNQAVIIWEDEVTQLETREIGERVSGEGDALKAKRIYVSADALKQELAQAKAAHAKDPADMAPKLAIAGAEYMLSIHILEENTLKNAKRLGYLDVQELYPDMPKHTLEEYAKEFYAMEDPGKADA
ncbi:NAD(P)-binding protein [Cubamyces sp. BRFM 1775]|nr:NAD(P)-binding protein [Cubamyces sp. BRFM 1775]